MYLKEVEEWKIQQQQKSFVSKSKFLSDLSVYTAALIWFEKRTSERERKHHW